MAEREHKAQEITWSEYLADPWSSLEQINTAIYNSREIGKLMGWYEDRVRRLPYMDEEDGPLTDGENWKAEFVIPGFFKRSKEALKLLLGRHPDLQVQKVFRPDDTFYVIVGRKFTKYKDITRKEVLFEWNQPVMIAREVLTEANILEEDLRIPVNGFLGTIRDTQGRMLMTVDQEATAETPNHAIVRLAVQASAGKIALMRGGMPEADKGLSELLKIYPGGDIEKLLDMAEFIMPIPPEDTNRDIKHNLLLFMPPIDTDSPLHSQLVEDGTRMWLSEVQLEAINAARLTSNHTITAVTLDRDVRLLRDFVS